MIVADPGVVASQDAGTVAVVAGRSITRRDSASGEVTVVEAAAAPQLLALAPHRVERASIATGTEVARLDSADASVPLPGQVMLLRAGDGGTVLALTRSDAAGSALVVLRGDPLVLVGERMALGSVAAYGLELDEDSAAAIVWGVEGARAWEGEGKPYVRRLAWGDGATAHRWAGKGLPREVAVLRTGGDRLVAVDGHQRLVTSRVDALLSRGAADGGSIELADEIDRVAISPEGKHLCVITVGAEGVRVRSGPFEGGELRDRGGVPDRLTATVVAVGDDGRLLVGGVRGNAAVAATAEPGALLEECWELEVPTSVHRRDV